MVTKSDIKELLNTAEETQLSSWLTLEALLEWLEKTYIELKISYRPEAKKYAIQLIYWDMNNKRQFFTLYVTVGELIQLMTDPVQLNQTLQKIEFNLTGKIRPREIDLPLDYEE